MAVVVVHIENGIFVECSTKKTTVYRTVGYESDTQFPAYIQHAVLLHESVHEVIFALYGREWTYGMCLTDCICAYLTHTPVLYFALFHQFTDGLCYFFGRGIGVGTVLVEHRECFKFQTTE